MRIIFMGSPAFSVPVLDALINAGHEIVAVYAQPPRPAGRGKKERPGPVHARALEHGLDVYTPVSLRTSEAQETFANHQADVAVVVAYGLILPQTILDMPVNGCLNIHASLLPRWRGAAPIHRAIMAGDAKTGVCIMQMEAGLDTGPVLLRKEIPIGAEVTTGELHDELAGLGAVSIVDALGSLPSLSAEIQSEVGVTYAEKIDKSEARIDWAKPAVEVDRQIRGLSPFPGAWCMVGDERVKLLGSRLVSGNGAPGQVLDGFQIACENGAVDITRAQRAGKRAMTADDVLQGLDLGEQIT